MRCQRQLERMLALCKIIQCSSRPPILARPPLVKISVSPVFSEITVLALHSASRLLPGNLARCLNVQL